ncbi:hypothetical protein LguiA_033888 [Lonicera macranthoides]
MEEDCIATGEMDGRVLQCNSHIGINFFLSSTAAISTIRGGDELNSTSQLVSQNGNFTLGFFTVDAMGYTYLEIWYGDKTDMVWFANQNTPIFNNSAVLAIDRTTGKLIISNGGTTILVISDEWAMNNGSATLQDSGNFVLIDDTTRRTLWQSFDHPTNAILPGMGLGFNCTIGQNLKLTSWLSKDILAHATFTMSWEPAAESGQLVVYRRGKLYWRSGLLINNSFEFIDESFTNKIYNFSRVSNSDDEHISFHAVGKGLPLWFLSLEGKSRFRYFTDRDLLFADTSFPKDVFVLGMNPKMDHLHKVS